MANLLDEQKKLEGQTSDGFSVNADAEGPVSFPGNWLAGVGAGIAASTLVGLASPLLVPAALATSVAAAMVVMRKKSQGGSHPRPESMEKDTAPQEADGALARISPREDERLDAEVKNLLSSMVIPMPSDQGDGRLAASWIAANTPQEEIRTIRKLATEVFGDAELAATWLLEPNIATENRPPVQLLGAADGLARVENLLLRIQFGVLA